MDNPIPPVIGYTLYIVIASIVIVCDIPFIGMIFGNRHLRSQKELVTLGFMCIADTSHAIATLVAGAFRLYVALDEAGGQPIQNTHCIEYVFPALFLFSYQLMGAATLAVSFDRVIAVMNPLKYRSLTNNFSFSLIAGISSYVSIVAAIFVYIVQTGTPTVSSAYCLTSEAYTPGIWKYMLYFRMSTLVISSSLYLPITWKIFKITSALKGGWTGETYTRKMIKTTRTIGCTILSEFFLVVIPDIFLNYNPFGLARYQVVWYNCHVAKGAVNVFLVTLQHEEMTKVLTKKWRRRSTLASTVVATTSSHPKSPRSGSTY